MNYLPHSLVIAGASGFGREVQWLAEQIAQSAGGVPRVECFIDDDLRRVGTLVNGLSVKGLDQALADHPQSALTIAIGSSAVRREIVRRAAARNVRFATLV